MIDTQYNKGYSDGMFAFNKGLERDYFGMPTHVTDNTPDPYLNGFIEGWDHAEQEEESECF